MLANFRVPLCTEFWTFLIRIGFHENKLAMQCNKLSNALSKLFLEDEYKILVANHSFFLCLVTFSTTRLWFCLLVRHRSHSCLACVFRINLHLTMSILFLFSHEVCFCQRTFVFFFLAVGASQTSSLRWTFSGERESEKRAEPILISLSVLEHIQEKWIMLEERKKKVFLDVPLKLDLVLEESFTLLWFTFFENS